jgi:hypothetical protein
MINPNMRTPHHARQQRQFLIVSSRRFKPALALHNHKKHPRQFQFRVRNAARPQQFHAPHFKILKKPAVMHHPHPIGLRISHSELNLMFCQHLSILRLSPGRETIAISASLNIPQTSLD